MGEDIVTAEQYQALATNLDQVMEAVEKDLLDPQDALAWERDDKNRSSYVRYLESLIPTSVSPEGEPVEDDSKPVEEGNQLVDDEQAEQRPSRDELTQMLLEQSESVNSLMFQQERVRNRALPSDPGHVRDWPEQELEYKWVPYKNDQRPLHPLEHANLQRMIDRGWAFYDNRYMERSPNANNYPWHPNWEAYESKVLFSGQVLMYRSAHYEARERAANVERNRLKRQHKKEQGRVVDDETGHSYTVQHEQGETTVDKLLREGKNTVDGGDSFRPTGAEAY